MYVGQFHSITSQLYKESEYYTKDFFNSLYEALLSLLVHQGMGLREIAGFLRDFPIDVAWAYKYCPDIDPGLFAVRHFVSSIVPISQGEAFKILDCVVPLEDKEYAIQRTREEYVTDEHFGLGAWIRNNWIYGIDCEDLAVKCRYERCMAMLSGSQPGEPHFLHEDTISSEFLERYYQHLISFVASKDPIIQVHRKPLKCRHCGSKVLSIVYGLPGPVLQEAAERGELILGGCCIFPDNPDYQCPICGQRYARIEKKDIRV